jgi:DNA-binding response OmpR family regulator
MKKILVVDDNTDLLEVVKIVLTTYGFEVQTHSSGLGVPEIVMAYNPDLILLDINLPGKIGTEICKELKEKHNIPILLFSAHADKRSAVQEARADGFIEKPFEMTHLLNTINSHINSNFSVVKFIKSYPPAA